MQPKMTEEINKQMLYICLTFKFEKGKYWKLKKKGVCGHDYELLLWSMYNALVCNFWIVYIRFPHFICHDSSMPWKYDSNMRKKNLFLKKKLTKKFLSQKLIEVNRTSGSQRVILFQKKKKKKKKAVTTIKTFLSLENWTLSLTE